MSPKNTGAVLLNRPSLLWNGGLPAPRIRERPSQPIEMRGPSAGIRRRCPCNLAKSPCISPNCRERQVGFGLPAQPHYVLVIEEFCVSQGQVEFAAEFRAVFASSDSVLSGRDNSAPNSVAPRYESLSGGIWGSTFQFGEDGEPALRKPRRHACRTCGGREGARLSCVKT